MGQPSKNGREMLISCQSHEEIWKEIPNFPKYEVSNLGRVRKHFKMRGIRLLKPTPDAHGYLKINPRENGIRGNLKVHQLVANLFLELQPAGMWPNHKDGDQSNNSANNLEWTTPSENTRHFLKLGKRRGKAKVCVQDIPIIRASRSPNRELAKIYGVQEQTIYRIKRGESWSWV